MTSNQKWSDLGIEADICEVLTKRGITSPFLIQTLTIPDALSGKDVCGKAKPGSGKPLAFGIPMIQNLNLDIKASTASLRVLILDHTRELAVQVSEELEPIADVRGLKIAAIYGGANIETQIKTIKKGLDVVAATPGRMIDLLERNEVSVGGLEMVVIDEADRMADMGFLPQVEWILRKVERKHQTLLFSATMDGLVNSLIQRYQSNP